MCFQGTIPQRWLRAESLVATVEHQEKQHQQYELTGVRDPRILRGEDVRAGIELWCASRSARFWWVRWISRGKGEKCEPQPGSSLSFSLHFNSASPQIVLPANSYSTSANYFIKLIKYCIALYCTVQYSTTIISGKPRRAFPWLPPLFQSTLCFLPKSSLKYGSKLLSNPKLLKFPGPVIKAGSSLPSCLLFCSSTTSLERLCGKRKSSRVENLYCPNIAIHQPPSFSIHARLCSITVLISCIFRITRHALSAPVWPL